MPLLLTLLLSILPILTLILAQPPWQNFAGFGEMSDCGQGCFFQNLRGSGCQFPNIGCVCSTEDFIPNLTTCANSQCNATEVEQVLGAASSLCDSVSTGSSIQTSTSRVSRTSQNSESIFTTSTRRPNTQPDSRSATTTPDSRPSTTAPPSETQSNPSTAGQATTPVGAIVGGVVGGFGGVSLILGMVWLIMREKNKGASIRALPPLKSRSLHTDQVEEQQPQPIWDGQQAFRWDHRADSTAELPAF